MMAGLMCELPKRESAAVRPAAPFEVRMSETGRGVLVRVRGPLDLHFTPQFQQQVDRYLNAGKPVVVDLRDTDYVDSSGVRALLQMQKELEAARGDLRLVVARGSRVERVIKLLQLQTHFHLFDSASEAWSRPTHTRAA